MICSRPSQSDDRWENGCLFQKHRSSSTLWFLFHQQQLASVGGNTSVWCLSVCLSVTHRRVNRAAFASAHRACNPNYSLGGSTLRGQHTFLSFSPRTDTLVKFDAMLGRRSACDRLWSMLWEKFYRTVKANLLLLVTLPNADRCSRWCACCFSFVIMLLFGEIKMNIIFHQQTR